MWPGYEGHTPLKETWVGEGGDPQEPEFKFSDTPDVKGQRYWGEGQVGD